MPVYRCHIHGDYTDVVITPKGEAFHRCSEFEAERRRPLTFAEYLSTPPASDDPASFLCGPLQPVDSKI